MDFWKETLEDGLFVGQKKLLKKCSLRSLESIDIASVEYTFENNFVRVYSSGFGEQSLPFLIYEETVWNELFKHFIEVQNNV